MITLQVACRATRYICTAGIFFFLYLASFSQEKQFVGYYVDNKGDTTRGSFANYRQWTNNPDKVSFIPAGRTDKVVLHPSNCKEFQITNYDTYISYQGSRLTNPINYNAATEGSNADAPEEINTFLRQIAAFNDYRFYIYKDEKRINLFYSKGNNPIIELQQKAAIINGSFWQSMTYQTQLMQLFPVEAAESKVDRISYTEESLVYFVNAMDRNKTGKNRIRNDAAGFIVTVGVSQNSFRFKGNRTDDFSKKSYPATMAPVASIGYVIPISRSFNKFFLFPQIKVSAFKHKATSYYDPTTSYPALDHSFHSSPVISVGVHLAYNVINSSHFKLAIAPGGGISFLVKNEMVTDYRITETRTDTETNNMEKATYLLDLQSLAVIKNKFVIWACYNLPAPVTNLVSTGQISALQFGVGYKF